MTSPKALAFPKRQVIGEEKRPHERRIDAYTVQQIWNRDPLKSRTTPATQTSARVGRLAARVVTLEPRSASKLTLPRRLHPRPPLDSAGKLPTSPHHPGKLDRWKVL